MCTIRKTPTKKKNVTISGEVGTTAVHVINTDTLECDTLVEPCAAVCRVDDSVLVQL